MVLGRDRARQAFGRAEHTAGIRDDADIDLGEGELGLVGRDDHVAGKRQLEAAAEGDAVHRGDHRLFQIEHLGQAGETADTVILVLGRRLEVPPGGKEAPLAPGHDGDAERGIVAEGGEGLAEATARRRIEGIGLGSVERDLDEMLAANDLHGIRHRHLLVNGLATANAGEPSPSPSMEPASPEDFIPRRGRW